MKTGTGIAMSLSPSRAEALAQKLERSQFSANCSSEEFAMICYALRSFVRPEERDTERMEYLFDVQFEDTGDPANKLERIRRAIDRALEVKRSSMNEERS